MFLLKGSPMRWLSTIVFSLAMCAPILAQDAEPTKLTGAEHALDTTRQAIKAANAVLTEEITVQTLTKGQSLILPGAFAVHLVQVKFIDSNTNLPNHLCNYFLQVEDNDVPSLLFYYDINDETSHYPVAEHKEFAAHCFAIAATSEALKVAIAKSRHEDILKKVASETVLREWKSLDGKFSVKARFVSQTATHVTLEKLDGLSVTVDTSKLCESDRSHLEAIAKSK